MKQYGAMGLAILLVFSLLLGVAGCSGKGKPLKKAEERVTTAESESARAAEIEHSPAPTEPTTEAKEITRTLPPEFMESQGADSLLEEMKERLPGEVIQNADGSVTLSIPEQEYQQFVQDLRAELEQSVKALLENEQYHYVKDISYSDDFSEVTAYVNLAEYNGDIDVTEHLKTALSSVLYQILRGKEGDKATVTLTLKDSKSKVLLGTFSYPPG